MMQSPEDPIFQEYDRGERIRQRATEISDNYETQLRGAGVDFDSDDAYNARAMLTLLAYRRVNYEVAVEGIPEDIAPEDQKPYLREETRNLQAQLFIAGMGKPWLELVDQEFPGDALTDSSEDLSFIAGKMAEDAEETATHEKHFAQAVDELHTFLQEQQPEPLTIDELQLLLQLAIIRGTDMDHASEMDKINLFDRARSLILRSEVRERAVWGQLINTFFNPQPRPG